MHLACKVIASEGFCQECQMLFQHTQLGDHVGGIAGHEQHLDAWPPSSDEPRQQPAIHPRHDHIGQQQVNRRRVLHAGDITGQAVEKTLLSQAQASANISIMDHSMVIDLITTGWLGLAGSNRCVGVYALDEQSGRIFAIRASHTVLATGGVEVIDLVLRPSGRSFDYMTALRRLQRAGVPLDGASDHGVSEALYLRDPDGNGVELYRDRPRGEWPRSADGGVAMFTHPLDLAGLLAEKKAD